MTRARKEQIALSDTTYYHCTARCVRRAFLCGNDDFSGKCYEYRRQWIVDRLFELADIFAIDVVAYAILSNHYHTILRINAACVDAWSDREVMERWCRIFKGSDLVQHYLKGGTLDQAQLKQIDTLATEWRERLQSISWFMRCLNEFVARKANEEDACKGRFWEGRFKSQALLDDAALLTCMAYVDLNPVRANMADTPEQSHFTSIQERIQYHRNPDSEQRLVPLVNTEQEAEDRHGIHFAFSDYLTLVDWTGRAIRQDKRGHIPDHLAPILQRLGINESAWCDGVNFFGKRFPKLAGRIHRLQSAAAKMGLQWCNGMAFSRYLYPS